MSLRILHIYKDYYPVLGGIEGHVRTLAEGQAALGHHVSVLVTNPSGLRTVVSQEQRVRVIRAARLATVASTPLSLALPRELWRTDADVIHLHFPYPVGEISQSGPTPRPAHGAIVPQRRSQAGGHLALVPAASATRHDTRGDAFIVASPQMRQSAYLVEHQARVHLIPYGLALARFRDEPGAADLTRCGRCARERCLLRSRACRLSSSSVACATIRVSMYSYAPSQPFAPACSWPALGQWQGHGRHWPKPLV